MATQNKTWQRKVLDRAKTDGYTDLYWYIEMAWQGNQCHAPATFPGVWVPVVQVGPDPIVSRNIADMLAHLFALSNPRTLSFMAALTSTEALAKTRCHWYLWFEDVPQDAVCSRCGGVEPVGHHWIDDAWLCGWCAGER